MVVTVNLTHYTAIDLRLHLSLGNTYNTWLIMTLANPRCSHDPVWPVQLWKIWETNVTLRETWSFKQPWFETTEIIWSNFTTGLILWAVSCEVTLILWCRRRAALFKIQVLLFFYLKLLAGRIALTTAPPMHCPAAKLEGGFCIKKRPPFSVGLKYTSCVRPQTDPIQQYSAGIG